VISFLYIRPYLIKSLDETRLPLLKPSGSLISSWPFFFLRFTAAFLALHFPMSYVLSIAILGQKFYFRT